MRRRRFLASLGGVGALSLAGCASSCPAPTAETALPSGWPTPRGTSTNVGRAPATAAPPANPSIREWNLYELPNFEGESHRGQLSAPVVSENTLYVASGVPFWPSEEKMVGRLYALDATAESVKVRWKHHLPGGGAGSPALLGGLVVAGMRDGAVVAFDSQTGESRWQRAVDGRPGTPTPAHGRVYVGDTGGTLYALHPANGRVCWSFATEGPVGSWFGPSHDAAVKPAADSDGVYAAFAVRGGDREEVSAGVLVALTPTGEERWRYRFETRNRPSTPVVADGTVYVSGQGTLHAVDSETGERRWQFATGYRGPASAPAVADGSVYFSSKNVYALDAATGDEQWRVVNQAREYARLTERQPREDAPVVAGNSVYVGVGALDRRTGERRWGEFGNRADSAYFENRSIGNSVRGGPAVAGGVLYVAFRFGRVVVAGGGSA